ncbi:formate dehydrogenase accessory protein FdhE, partial [Burkholderia pseudomallei]
ALDAQDDALVAQLFAVIAPASAPFQLAEVQLVWTAIASRNAPADVPYLEKPGLCPLCLAKPVESIVRVGGQCQGSRCLQCG